MGKNEQHIYAYPQSESQLEEWENAFLSEGPTTIVKLAYRALRTVVGTPLWQAAKENDFDAARSSLWQQASASQHFLSQRRFATNKGHRFVRLHAITTDLEQGGPAFRRPPKVDSPYWRSVSMFFTHLNGPFAGEETYVIPQALDQQVGLSTQSQETLVFLNEYGEPRGCSTVEYNISRTQVARRGLFEPHDEITVQAGRIANAILARDDLPAMRMPVAKPPQFVEEDVGIRALPLAYAEPKSFDDLLPPAIIQELNA